MINGLAAEGKSLLISSHILTELAEISTKVAIIEQGLLLAYGSVDEILRGPNGSCQHHHSCHGDRRTGTSERCRSLSTVAGIATRHIEHQAS